MFINGGMFGTTVMSTINQQTAELFYTDYEYDFVLFLFYSSLWHNIILIQSFLLYNTQPPSLGSYVPEYVLEYQINETYGQYFFSSGWQVWMASVGSTFM